MYSNLVSLTPPSGCKHRLVYFVVLFCIHCSFQYAFRNRFLRLRRIASEKNLMFNFCQISCSWFPEKATTKHPHCAYYNGEIYAGENPVVVEILFLVVTKTLFTLCALVTCHVGVAARRCILGTHLGAFKHVLLWCYKTSSTFHLETTNDYMYFANFLFMCNFVNILCSQQGVFS